MKLDVLQAARARQVLGDLRSDELPGIAAEALEAGHDVPALRRLAGLSGDDPRTWSMFEDVLSSLGISNLTPREALMRLAHHVAEQIVSGRVSPYDGARRIWTWSIHADERVPQFDTFAY